MSAQEKVIRVGSRKSEVSVLKATRTKICAYYIRLEFELEVLHLNFNHIFVALSFSPVSPSLMQDLLLSAWCYCSCCTCSAFWLLLHNSL